MENLHKTDYQRNKDFQYYLTISSESHAPVNTTALAEACACGYTDALHWARKYSPVLTISKPCLYERIKADVKTVSDYDNIPELDACCRYLNHGSDRRHFSITVEPELTKAFLTGYVAALHWACKYDEALYLTGSMLVTHILANLYLLQKKRSDAYQACARIVHKVENKFCGMTFDVQCIDDEGKPVTQS